MLLKEFYFEFKNEKQSYEEMIKALDKSQAIMFADKIARRLDVEWGSTVNWELLREGEINE